MRVDLSARYVMVSSERTGNLIAVARVAATDEQRKLGLLNDDPLEPGRGLWIVPCERIHTFGMKFPIDVVFLDGTGRIVYLRKEVDRSQHCAHERASSCLELPAGAVTASGVLVGDRLLVTPLD